MYESFIVPLLLMAVAFDDEDRSRIDEILLRTGEELFTTQGLRKTSLAELTAPAGIATSSFYAFYAAKEALYLELMIRRAPMHRARLEAALATRPVLAALVSVMRMTAHVLGTDPFYRRLLTHPDELAAVARRLGPDELRRVEPHLLRPLVEFVQRAQDADELAPAPPVVVVGALRTVGLIALHRDDYGDDYPEVLDLTIRSLATGLVTPQDGGGP